MKITKRKQEQMAQHLTSKDVALAVEVLRQHSVPPVACPACGVEFYLAPPPGWVPGNALKFDCDCGVELVVIETVRCGGEMASGRMLPWTKP